MCRSLNFNNVAGWRHSINTKSKLSVPFTQCAEAVVQRYSVKKVLPVSESLFNKVAGLKQIVKINEFSCSV